LYEETEQAILFRPANSTPIAKVHMRSVKLILLISFAKDKKNTYTQIHDITETVPFSHAGVGNAPE